MPPWSSPTTRSHRQPEGVAEAHEAGELLGGVDVEGAGVDHGLVGDDAHGTALEAGEADDDVGGEVLLDLDELTVVDQGGDDVDDVVGPAGGGGHDRAHTGGGQGVQRSIAEKETSYEFSYRIYLITAASLVKLINEEVDYKTLEFPKEANCSLRIVALVANTVCMPPILLQTSQLTSKR